MSQRPSPGLQAIPDIAASADDVAAIMLTRVLKGPMKPSEQAEFEAWLAADVLNSEAYARVAEAYERIGEAASAQEIMAMRREALAFEVKKPAFGAWVLAAAACALFAAIIGFSYLGNVPSIGPQIASQSSMPAAAPRDHYATAVGERLTATLSDGSILTLNTASEVKIHYTQALRRIEVVRGQVFFSVAHKPEWPFIVEGAGQAVRALGTEFEVRIDNGHIGVVLVQGRIAVGKPRALASGDLRGAVEMQAGERAISEGDLPIAQDDVSPAYEVSAVDAVEMTTWRNGRIVFNSTPLSEAVAEINRYRATPLVIEGAELAAQKISGVFRTADANGFAAVLGGVLPVEEKIRPDGQPVLVRRD